MKKPRPNSSPCSLGVGDWPWHISQECLYILHEKHSSKVGMQYKTLGLCYPTIGALVSEQVVEGLMSFRKLMHGMYRGTHC
jgi:hypothetical protein